jgi:hypothetical protein
MMKVYTENEVTKKVEVLKTIKCDSCERDINELDTAFYYEVTTHHNLWGNDSIDSFEHLEFCSYDCLLKDMSRYFSDADVTYAYEIERNNK